MSDGMVGPHVFDYCISSKSSAKIILSHISKKVVLVLESSSAKESMLIQH